VEIGLEPVLVRFGPYAVRWFGLLALVGLGSGVWLTLHELDRLSIRRAAVLNAVCWAVPIGVLGARVVHVVGWWDFYLLRPADIWQLSMGELSLWGGLVSGGLAVALALRHDPVVRRALFNAAAPGVALGIAIGQVGAFVDGAGQGLPTDLAWATTYSSPSSSTPDFGVPRHPAQMYDALVCIGLLVVLLRLPMAVRARVFILGYATARMLAGAVRLEPAFLFGLQIEQILALVVAVGVIVRSATRRVARGMRRVTLYHRPGCHLCEDVAAELRRLRQRYPHEVEMIDVSSDAALEERYGERIPVLRVGEREYAAPLMRATLVRALQSETP